MGDRVEITAGAHAHWRGRIYELAAMWAFLEDVVPPDGSLAPRTLSVPYTQLKAVP